MVRHFTLTLSGSAQQLNAEGDDSAKNFLVTGIAIQADAANANPVYIGGPAVSASDYGIMIQTPTSTIPDPPVVLETGGKVIRANDVYVIGTATQKVHVLIYGGR